MLTNWSTTEKRLHKFKDLENKEKTGEYLIIFLKKKRLFEKTIISFQKYLDGIKYMTGFTRYCNHR